MAKNTDEIISELRARLDEMEKALGLKPSDEDMTRLRERLDSVVALMEAAAPPVPSFELLPGTRPGWKPVAEGGAILLHFTPENGQHVIVTREKSKKLPTGVKLVIPAGYIGLVAQKRANGSATVLDQVRRYAEGTTAEIEIVCTADEHDGGPRPVRPGEVIGCAWLEKAEWTRKTEVKA